MAVTAKEYIPEALDTGTETPVSAKLGKIEIVMFIRLSSIGLYWQVQDEGNWSLVSSPWLDNFSQVVSFFIYDSTPCKSFIVRS